MTDFTFNPNPNPWMLLIETGIAYLIVLAVMGTNGWSINSIYEKSRLKLQSHEYRGYLFE